MSSFNFSLVLNEARHGAIHHNRSQRSEIPLEIEDIVENN